MPGRMIVIASSTRDLIGGSERVGGPAFYIGTALHLLGAEAVVVTGEGAAAALLRGLHGIRVEVAGGGETLFSIDVDGDSRTLRLIRASRMELGGAAGAWGPGTYIISGTMGEIPVEVVEEAADRGPVILDLQGFVREAADGGEVASSADLARGLMRRLAGLGVLVRGERFEFPPECRDEGIAGCSRRYGLDMAITDAGNPFYLAVGGSIYRGHPIWGIHGEPIGVGDVFTAALGHYLLSLGLPAEEAAARASAAATLKLRGRQPWFTPAEVEGAARRVRVERLG